MAEKANANFEQALKANRWAETSQCASTKHESLTKCPAIYMFPYVYMYVCHWVCE